MQSQVKRTTRSSPSFQLAKATEPSFRPLQTAYLLPGYCVSSRLTVNIRINFHLRT
jgi:hypothetical protein